MKQQESLHRAQATRRKTPKTAKLPKKDKPGVPAEAFLGLSFWRELQKAESAHEQVTLTLPKILKHTAQLIAREEGVTLNRFITQALVERVNKEDAAAFFAKRGKGGSAARAIRFLKNRPE